MRIVALDLGGTNIEGALICDRAVLRRNSRPTETASDWHVITQLCDMIKELAADADGIAIASAGWVDSKAGRVLRSPNLPLRDVSLAAILEEKTGLPVKIENDANCAALGEYYLGGAGIVDNLLVLTLGTGLGAGVILNRRLLRGIGSAELGHVVLDVNGRRCNCGRKGCAEQYLSAAALVALAGEQQNAHPHSMLFKQMLTPEHIFACFAQEDAAACCVVEQYAAILAEAVVNYINCFGDIHVFLGGGIARAGKLLLDPLNQRLCGIAKQSLFPDNIHEVKQCALERDAGILGAYLLYEEEQND